MSPSIYVPAERERPENLEEFRAFTTPMWMFDQKTLAILEVNQAATEYYGYSRSEFLRMTILDIRPLEDIPKLLQSAFGRHEQRSKSELWRHQKKDGTVFQAKIVSWEIELEGRKVELVSAEVVKAASAQH